MAAAALGGTLRLPNIVFILADDLGYGDLGCYGQDKIRTPNLDRMVSEGTRFTSAYSGSTVCAPSRACLMTGRHTGHVSVRGNQNPEMGLAPDETTVASLLKKAGYRTALFGKWGLGGPATGSVPNLRGFDEFFGYLNQLHAHNSYPEHLWDNQEERLLTENWFDARKSYSNDLFTNRAIEFLKRQSAQPFFLYLAYTIPHANNELGRVRSNGMECPDLAPYADRDWPEVEKTFAASVTRMDAAVGRVLHTLAQQGLESNTLVVFTSDNGPHKEGHHSAEFFRSSGPLRGTKRDLYEGGIRVPSIARWPGMVPAGRLSVDPWAFWDFLPTAAELAGAEPPAAIDGISIVPALLGKPQRQHEYFYWEFHEGGFHQALRQGDWKLVRQGGRPLLFNIRDDLGETRDLAAAHPEIVARLEPLFRTARTDSRDFPVPKGNHP